jgi:hypothetical protein
MRSVVDDAIRAVEAKKKQSVKLPSAFIPDERIQKQS